MKRLMIALALCAGVLGALPAMHVAAAHDYRAGDLLIRHPAVLAAPASASEATGFLTIRNRSREADRLLSVRAPDIADIVDILIVPRNGLVVSKTATAALDVPARQDTVLTPAANHIVFRMPKRALVADDSFPATLTFEKAGEVEVIFHVQGGY